MTQPKPSPQDRGPSAPEPKPGAPDRAAQQGAAASKAPGSGGQNRPGGPDGASPKARPQPVVQASKETAEKTGKDTGQKAAAPQPAQKPAQKPTPKPAPAKGKAEAAQIRIAPPVPPARRRPHHKLLMISFAIMVVVPILVSAWYLWARAQDQYASYVGFSVRTEEVGSAIELLGGITELSGSSSSDTDILYKFLQSQELVATVDAALDLRGIWAKADPEVDPIFAYDPPGTIEDLQDHWLRKVSIYYDSGSGLLDLRVLAFDPADARAIAEMIFAESSARINALSALAREDAIAYARDELIQAETRLRDARLALNEFRNRTQIVDPTIDTQGQMGLVNTLQAQLADALIEVDLLRETTRTGDPRITQGELRIAVIERRIEEERRKVGLGGGVSGDRSVFADLVGEFERLSVDLEFAQQSYVAALATFDAARNEARRQSRYLAAHVRPTLAERAEYPQRIYLLGLIGLFSFLAWTITALIAYSLRDRR